MEERENIRQEIQNNAKKKLLFPTIKVPVYRVCITYYTSRDNYKQKTLYYIGHLYYDEEFMELNSEDFVAQIKKTLKKRCSDITADDIKYIGHIYVSMTKDSNSEWVKNYTDDRAGHLLTLLKSLQKKDFLNKNINVPISKISYQQETTRGATHEFYKYVISENPKQDFLSWIKKFNLKYPVKALLNVEILNMQNLGIVEV